MAAALTELHCDRCHATWERQPYERPQQVVRLAEAGFDFALCSTCLKAVLRCGDIDSMLRAIATGALTGR